MSKVRVGDDDHADAAGKHRADAEVLLDASRHDGAGYLSGYVVECALKAVILHDKSFNPTTATHDPAILANQHKVLSRKPYGHDLLALLAVTVTTHGAPYVPTVPPLATLRTSPWKETLRYFRDIEEIAPTLLSDEEYVRLKARLDERLGLAASRKLTDA